MYCRDEVSLVNQDEGHIMEFRVAYKFITSAAAYIVHYKSEPYKPQEENCHRNIL